MSLLDELEPIRRKSPGPKCTIQQLRVDQGDAFAREVLEVVIEPGWSVEEKQAVLGEHDVYVHRGFIDRHRRVACEGCRRWLL